MFLPRGQTITTVQLILHTKRFKKPQNVSQPGDIIYIREGIYKGNIKITRSGTANNYITYTAFPGDEHKAIIEGTTLRTERASYIKITNLRVQNTGNEGIYVLGLGSNIIVENNETFNTRASGIGIWGVAWGSDPGNYLNLRNVKVNHNSIEKACNGGYNERITLSNGVVDFEVNYNEVFNGGDPVNGGEGIDIKLGCSEGEIAYNNVHDLTRRGLYLDGGANNLIGDFNKAFVKNVDIHSNISFNNVGHGLAIMTEGFGDVFNINIYNNLFYNNTDDGFMIFKHPGAKDAIIHDIKIYNNTMIDNDRYGILVNYEGAYNITSFNNILYQNNNGDYRLAAGNSTENDNLIGINPQFVDANSKNYKLKPNSPAINAGVSGAPNVDLEGNPRVGVPDIGAYEFVDSSCNSLVSFVTPSDGDTFPSGSNIEVEINATDNDGVDNVKLYINNTLVREENTLPYQWGLPNQNDVALENLDPGIYVIKAVTEDSTSSTCDNTITITIADCNVASPIVCFSNVDNQGWEQSCEATRLQQNQTIELGPHPIGGTWSWIGPNNYTSNTREITVSEIGTYIATYNNGKCSFSESFTINQILSNDEFNFSNEFKIFPNPVGNKLNIQFSNNQSQELVK